MRIFELTTHINSISRAQGRTATAAAAYRAGAAIYCQYADTEHDYTRKGGVVFSEIVLPETAPAWAANRAALWNAAETVERNGKRGKNAGQWKAKAQTAREVMFSFPHELSDEGRIAIARRIASHLAATGVAADVNIHAPGREGDQRNWHCHILLTTRVFNGDQLGKKAAWQTDRRASRALSKGIRAFIARSANDQLAAEGKSGVVHVEHRSFEARGITRKPQAHLGPKRTNQQRRERRQERQTWQETTAKAERARQVAENKRLREEQNARWREHSKQWEHQKRQAVRRMVAAARAARRADQEKPGTLRALFMRVTGQTARLEAAQHARATERLATVRWEIRALRSEIATQKEQARTQQKSERQVQKDRHAAENVKLSHAFNARVGRDLAAERAQRGAENRMRDQERERDTGRSLDRDFDL